MKSEMEKIKDRYEKLKKDNNKQTYNDCAKIIVGFKIVKHMVLKLPKAIEEKKKDKESETKSSLYKNKSVFDYIENPEFEYIQEVERISSEIEQKVDVVNKGMKNIREKTSVFYWIKILISKIKNRDKKMLTEGKKEEENSKFKEDRLEFLEKLREKSETKENQTSNNIEKVEQKIEEKEFER